VFRLHMPAAIRPNISARFNLNGAKPRAFYVSDNDIDVRDTLRSERRNVSAPKQFGHNVMFTSRAEQSRLRRHSVPPIFSVPKLLVKRQIKGHAATRFHSSDG
jgi:hypothetical protein